MSESPTRQSRFGDGARFWLRSILAISLRFTPISTNRINQLGSRGLIYFRIDFGADICDRTWNRRPQYVAFTAD